MRSGHIKTWRLWLDRVSPISQSVSNCPTSERDSMAEALAIASPGGPRGFHCVDECDCHRGTKYMATRLFSAIAENVKNKRAFLEDGDAKISKLSDAILVDLASRAEESFSVFLALADTEVQVSARSAQVSEARIRFSRTWQVLQTLISK